MTYTRGRWGVVLALVCAACALLAADAAQARPLAAPAPSLTGTVRVYGYVSEQGGAPASGVMVDAWDDVNAKVGQTPTDSAGFYSLALPLCDHCGLMFTQWMDGGPYSFHKYDPIIKTLNTHGVAEMRIDVTLTPVAIIILDIYDRAGNQIRYGRFPSVTEGYFSAADADDLPVYISTNAVQDDYFHEHGGNWDLALPALLVPPQTRLRLHLEWVVPQVGDLIIDVDAGAEGYLTPPRGGYMALNLNREAAFSAVSRLAHERAAFASQGYSFSISVTTGLTLAQASLAAGEAHMAHAPPEAAQAVADFEAALSQALLAQEQLYLDKAEADIPRHRQGELTLSLRTASGLPIAGALVTYQQRTRDFRISAGTVTENIGYVPIKGDLMQQMGANGGPVGVDFGMVEPSSGVFDWTYVDTYSGLNEMLAKGFSLDGAVAYYAFPDQESHCPPYWRNLTFAQLKQQVFEHFRVLAARYGTRIGPWMLNEQNLPWGNCLGLTWEQRFEIFKAVNDGLRAGDPNARNQVTSVVIPWSFGQAPLPTDGSEWPAGVPFPSYLDALLQRGLPLDNISLEFHFFGVSVPEGGGYALPGMTLASLARLMDRYDAYDIPLWIEPFQVPSQQVQGSAWWHRPWDEATQAEFAVKFYTLAFSRKNMHDICWSDVSDRTPFIVSAGLLDSDYQPKPAYYALQSLIRSWTTSGQGVTDGNGDLRITGFAGDYDVAVTLPSGQQVRTSTHIHEQTQTSATVAIQLLALPVIVSAW